MGRTSIRRLKKPGAKSVTFCNSTMRITLTLLYANATKQFDPGSMQVIFFFCKAETGATTILLQWTWTSCSCSTSKEEGSLCHPVEDN